MKKNKNNALKAYTTPNGANKTDDTKLTNKASTGNIIQDNIVQNDPNTNNQLLNDFRYNILKVYPELEELPIEDLLQAAFDRAVYSDKLCTKMSDQNKAIAEILISNPRLYIFIQEMMKETPIRVALVKSDLTDLAPDEEDEDYESYNMAVAQSRERREILKEKIQNRIDKCEKCGEVAQQFYDDNEVEDDEIEEFVEFFEKVIEAIFDADIDREVIEAMWKAYSFEKEVQQAREQGIVDGKNQVITIRRKSNSDGLPSSSSGGIMRDETKHEGYIEKLLNRKFQ